eukprot:scaffold13801_cov162-Isochrysis_galbana.AAC.1
MSMVGARLPISAISPLPLPPPPPHAFPHLRRKCKKLQESCIRRAVGQAVDEVGTAPTPLQHHASAPQLPHASERNPSPAKWPPPPLRPRLRWSSGPPTPPAYLRELPLQPPSRCRNPAPSRCSRKVVIPAPRRLLGRPAHPLGPQHGRGIVNPPRLSAPRPPTQRLPRQLVRSHTPDRCGRQDGPRHQADQRPLPPPSRGPSEGGQRRAWLGHVFDREDVVPVGHVTGEHVVRGDELVDQVLLQGVGAEPDLARRDRVYVEAGA